MLSLLGNTAALLAVILAFYILFMLIYEYNKYGRDNEK